MKKVCLLLLALLLSSCGDSENPTLSGSSARPADTSDLPFVIRSSGGVLDATGEKLEIRLIPDGESVAVGENSEGGVLDLSQFLSQKTFSEESPGVVELEYQVEGQTSRRLPLSLLSITREQDGSLVLQALERIEVESTGNSVKGQFESVVLDVQVSSGDSPVAGAGVRADLVEDPLTYNQTTDQFGMAIFRNIQFGTYNITVTKTGFRTQMAQTLVLQNPNRLTVQLIAAESTALISAKLKINP